jgi:hypothetical protein
MPKPKKPSPDPAKLNQIDAYTYDDYNRANISPVGMAQYDRQQAPKPSTNTTPTSTRSCNGRVKKKGPPSPFPHHQSTYTNR